MAIKSVRMGIPILVSRSGFTALGVELARNSGLALIGGARGKRCLALACPERVTFDRSLDYVAEESARHHRTSADDDG
jgi:FdhD protein